MKDKKIQIKIITRFHREDFIQGASSLEALSILLRANAEILALQNLHSKLYIFDEHSAILGSANFTSGGFSFNHELGIIIIDEHEISEECNYYFQEMWKKINTYKDCKVTQSWIDDEQKAVNQSFNSRSNKGVSYGNIIKRGADIPLSKTQDFIEEQLKIKISNELPSLVEHTGIWLKFEGLATDRANNDESYEQFSGGKDKTLTTYFPRKPTGIQQNDLIFIAVLTHDKNNLPTPIIIGYGEAEPFIEQNHASADEIKKDPWKERFPYYIQLQNIKYIKAPLKEGIPIIELYRNIKNNTFPSLINRNNFSIPDLKKMHFRRSHIQITDYAKEYLLTTLNELFTKYGVVSC